MVIMSNKEEKKEIKKDTPKKSSVSRFFIQRIEQWLEREMENDPLFAETVKSKPQKTVEGACNYVLSVAKKTGQAGWDDEEVYGLIRHFYDEDSLKDPGNQNPSKVIVSGHIDLTEEEKKKAMEEAKAEYKKDMERKAAAAEKERKEKERQAAEERRKKLEEKRAESLRMQGDLFGGL
jgi:hypothetical protein